MSDLTWLVVAAAAAAALLLARVLYTKLRKPTLPKGITVHFTNHARERMAQRSITSEQVTSVLAKPDRQEPDPSQNSVRLERDFDGRSLRVWVAQPWPAEGEIVVKTTAWRLFATVKVPVERIGHIIGRNGRTINEIQESTGARISVANRDGTISIRADDLPTIQAARARIEAIAHGSLSGTRAGEGTPGNTGGLSQPSKAKPGRAHPQHPGGNRK